MQNLIKSRAVFEILKKPLPELLRFYRDSDSDSDCEESSTDVASCSSEANTANVSAAETAKAPAIATATETTEVEAETEAEAAAKLNVNASVFVPRLKDAEDVHLVDLKRQFEALDARKPLTQPKLLLPWKGFPKPQHVERVSKPILCKEAKPAIISTETENKTDKDKDKDSSNSGSRKKPLKERAIVKSAPDEKRREQERKVALEALKLVEQRRMREPSEQPQIIVHLTRSPVEFTAEERVRVNRLRIIKREHIERVLREMREEREPKQPKVEGGQPVATGRYICLKRATQSDAQTEQKQQEQPQKLEQQQPLQQQQQPPQKQQQQPPLASSQPKRYIPTVKQWDERCKAKAHEAALGANKENSIVAKNGSSKYEEHQGNPQRAMVSSSQGNIMRSKQTQPAGAGVKDRELFVPRYWPPASAMVKGEMRRGNLTHARNITRAFANCGLLPTPAAPWEQEDVKDEYELMSSRPLKPLKRYNMEQLLKLEPQPNKLEKPNIAEALSKLGFMCE